ncbi:MAG: 2,3-bisphosphoglycerate-independent phosphoglycerate mutase [Desulforhopalus sp.]|jgi:2,3-bisphosphoglycerate-independent phosphoglycerate mutase
MRSADTPEQAFLENNTEISHADMMNCLVTRTSVIINCLHVSLENTDTGTMTNNMITEVLWQVSGNLDQIDKLTNEWHKEISKQQTKTSTPLFALVKEAA